MRLSEFQSALSERQNPKLKLHESPVPSIAALGQKGGSTIAAAVINAILYQLKLGTTDYERYSVSDLKQAPEKGEGL